MRGGNVGMAALTVAGAWVLVSAPEPLPDGDGRAGRRVSAAVLFDVVAAENDAVRALYTSEIVGRGLERGFAFDEDWRRADVRAGPLPALFLRSMAGELERSPVRLSVFLGSDHPIRPENAFSGLQAKHFAAVRSTRLPQRFVDPTTGRFTAMYPDIAAAEACVTCHNEHPDSPKRDWGRDDVMGATTWLFPDGDLTVDELVETVAELRRAMRTTWEAVLEEAETFDPPPKIGDRWPRDGWYLPSADVFMAELARRSSPGTVQRLTDRPPDGITPEPGG